MISPIAAEQFKAHCLSEYPREACGVAAGDEYIPITNVHPDPEKSFELSPAEMCAADNRHLFFDAILHSHPNHSLDFPSNADMEQQEQSGIPWGISTTDGKTVSGLFFFGDQVPIPPLKGRAFRWGVTDCWTLVRDWYRLHARITLPIFPRDRDALDRGIDLFAMFPEAGFCKIDRLEKIGDCMLWQLGATVPNHVGILVEDEMLLQQPLTGVSRALHVGPWLKKAVGFFRHESRLNG